MKKNYLKTLLWLFCSLAFLTACDKDDEPAAPTKKDLLVAHEWKGSQVLINNLNVAAIPGIGSNAASFQTMRLAFKADNTYTATISVRGQQQDFEGAWQLNADQSKLTMDTLGEFDIAALTETNLNLMALISNENVNLIARLMGIDPGIINLFLGGASVQTEMRFVK